MKIIAVIDATFAVAKRKPEKIQACIGFEPLNSAIPVQHSTNKFYFELTHQLGAGLNQNHYNVNFELRLHCINTKQIKNYEDKKRTNLRISGKHFLIVLMHTCFLFS